MSFVTIMPYICITCPCVPYYVFISNYKHAVRPDDIRHVIINMRLSVQAIYDFMGFI